MPWTLKPVPPKEAISGMYLMGGGSVVSEPVPPSSQPGSQSCSLRATKEVAGLGEGVQHQASWLKFHVHEGVPSLPHCLGNPHRGTSGQMQSTKQAVKHIRSLRPMGAHLVNEQEKAPQ